MRSISDLKDYQKEVIKLILDKKKFGVFMKMGLGKTVTALTAISIIPNRGKVLVIAPMRVVQTVWAEEAESWEHLRHLKIVKVVGTPVQRLAALNKDADIYLISRDNLQWLPTKFYERFNAIFVDESSSFKKHNSGRSKALHNLIAVSSPEYVVLLTGTPTGNSMLDLWSQIYCLDKGARLERNYYFYRKKYFNEKINHVFTTYYIKPGAEETILNNIKDISISLDNRDFSELPEPMSSIYRIDLPDDIYEFYLDLKEKMVAELKGATIYGKSETVVLGKLMQIANGCIYDATGKAIILHTAKIEALKEIVDFNESENIIVAINYKHDATAILKSFPESVMLSDDPNIIKKWNEGKIKMLIMHPASGGHGLNLQFGGSIMVWYGLTWSTELYQQMNARLHRPGQKKIVSIIHIVADGTVDEIVLKVLKSGESRLDTIFAELGMNKQKGAYNEPR